MGVGRGQEIVDGDVRCGGWQRFSLFCWASVFGILDSSSCQLTHLSPSWDENKRTRHAEEPRI
jgi:hypothetical protein